MVAEAYAKLRNFTKLRRAFRRKFCSNKRSRTLMCPDSKRTVEDLTASMTEQGWRNDLRAGGTRPFRGPR